MAAANTRAREHGATAADGDQLSGIRADLQTRRHAP
jgi:hypothetical protein